MDNHETDLPFDAQVEWFKDIFVSWLQNMQRDAFAKGKLIAPEVIEQAFLDLAEYYEILGQDMDKNIDEAINKLLGE